MDDAAVHAHVEAVEQALARLDELPDEARAAALAAVEGLLALYGEGLRRIVGHAAAAPAVADALREDELVSHLMLLHEVHPATLEERIGQALDEVRPYMGSHGGGIELLEVAGDVARVRLQGTCSGCGASTVTMKLAVEEAVLRAAPELRAVEAVEVEAADMPAPTGVALPMARTAPQTAPATAPGAPADAGVALAGELLGTSPSWVAAGGVAQLAGDGALRREVAGSPLLFAREGDDLYAYLDRCPACRAPLAEPRLERGALCCGGCGRRYDVRRAGMGVDGGLLQLDPVPLLIEDGEVRVALGAVAA